MDAIIILGIILFLVIFLKRTFSGFIYSIASVDIFLRIMTFFKNNIPDKDIANIINKYFPESIISIIDKYTDGVLMQVLVWIYVIIMCIFLFYTIRTLIRKK